MGEAKKKTTVNGGVYLPVYFQGELVPNGSRCLREFEKLRPGVDLVKLMNDPSIPEKQRIFYGFQFLHIAIKKVHDIKDIPKPFVIFHFASVENGKIMITSSLLENSDSEERNFELVYSVIDKLKESGRIDEEGYKRMCGDTTKAIMMRNNSSLENAFEFPVMM